MATVAQRSVFVYHGDMRKAFTLIELLVVIAIIAILAAILFPVFAQARNQANQSKCLLHMRQVGMAITMYTGDNNNWLPMTWNWSTGWCANYASWKQMVKPYQKEDQLYLCPSYTAGRVDCKLYFSNPQVRWPGEFGINNWAYVPSFTNADPNSGAYYKYRTAKMDGVSHPASTVFASENGDGDWISEPEDNVCVDPWSKLTLHTVDPGVIKFRHSGKTAASAVFLDGHGRSLSRAKAHADNCYLWWKRKPER